MVHRRNKYGIFHRGLSVVFRNDIKAYDTTDHIVGISLLCSEIPERVHAECTVAILARKPFGFLNDMGMMPDYNINAAIGKKLCHSLLLGVGSECALVAPMDGHNDEFRLCLCLCGLPYNMNGTEGPSAAAARELGEALAERTGLPLIYQDERMTTVSAQRVLIEGDVSRKKRKEVIDTVAAVFILQAYLDKQR